MTIANDEGCPCPLCKPHDLRDAARMHTLAVPQVDWKTIREAGRAYYNTLPSPYEALVERELSCATCRRVFCRVRAPESARIEPVCPGCVTEGRA